MRRSFAELLGTFCLVFAGTGSIVIDQAHGGVTPVGIAMTFGLVVMSMIYALGPVSGAHLNPAVTLAFWAFRGFPGRRAAAYIGAQGLGAILASLLLRAAFPQAATLGQTLPTAGVWPAFVLEAVLTFILMFVILQVSTKAMEVGLMAGVAVGGVVLFEALFAGPACGASMNPARSLGPALVAGDLGPLWIYLIAPCAGAILSCGAARVVMGRTAWDNAVCRPDDPACAAACACGKS